MGLFDLRCGISRVSTLWRPSGLKRKMCTMCLVEQIGEAWEPCTPPVSGTYDRYGAIELWAEDVSPYTEWVGDRLWRLFEVGALTTSWPAELDHEARRQSSRVERMLHHGAETAYNGVDLKIDGRTVMAFLAIDVFAEAIEAAAPAPPATLAEALARLFPEGGVGRARFADAPAGALPQLRRWACVREFMRPRGGLVPIKAGDGSQHSDDQIRRSVRGAWERGGPIAAVIERLEPAGAARWRESEGRRAAEAAQRADDEAGEGRAYSAAQTFAVGERIDHPKFGRGRVEAIVDGTKIRVRFADETRTLVHRPG